MPNVVQKFVSSIIGAQPNRRVSPFKEAGVSGTGVFGGFVETVETSPKLQGQRRYQTAAELLANVSIIAAGLRFFLNLTADPGWKVEPAEDLGDGKSSDAAKRAAEFVESALHDMDTSWKRIVRRSGTYRFHGFGIQEWTAKRRQDGLIGLLDIEPRPQHTIERWDIDLSSGSVLGVWQRSPQTGEAPYLPRGKIIYLVDDLLTDSPEGMGLFRHLLEPAERLMRYQKLEGLGYERDLRGIPIGRAPLADINAAVAAGDLTKEEGASLLDGLRKFVKLQVKAEDTGLIMDSKTYEGTTADGVTVSGTAQWGVDLLKADAGGFADLGKAIERLRMDMAMILGTEVLLMGSTDSGSRALSADKSRNLYLSVNSTLGDLASGIGKDVIDPLWRLNGLPDELKPSLKTEDASYKDAQEVAATLRDMATAGAVLQPDDPAIDDVRDLLGVSRQPESAKAVAAMDLELQQAKLESAKNPPPPVVAPAQPGAPPAPKPKQGA